MPFIQNTFFLYPPNINELTDRSWVKVSGGTLLKKAAFFGSLLPGALKVLLQHPPAACWIDEALLMGRHILDSVRTSHTFFFTWHKHEDRVCFLQLNRISSII